MLDQSVEGHRVALDAKTANDSDRRHRHIGMMPKTLACEDIRQVDFHHRALGRLQRIEQRDRRVRIGAGIEHDARRAITRLVHPLDQLAFVIGLSEVGRDTEARRVRLHDPPHIVQRRRAVDGRLALSEHVEVGSIEDEYRRRHLVPKAGSPFRRKRERLGGRRCAAENVRDNQRVPRRQHTGSSPSISFLASAKDHRSRACGRCLGHSQVSHATRPNRASIGPGGVPDREVENAGLERAPLPLSTSCSPSCGYRPASAACRRPAHSRR